MAIKYDVRNVSTLIGVTFVRRRIDFYVQRPPQGDPHRRVVWRRYSLIMHDVLYSLGFRLLSV
jgi:hypothetical protein